MKALNNYKILFGLRVFKSILTSFTDSFLVLYFLTLSENNILPLGIYYLVSMTVVFITIFLLRNFCKSKKRIYLLRLGIIMDFIYFLSIILLKDKVIDYIYLLGILYGLEEGLYYSVYNMFESNGVNNEERAKFQGYYTSIKSILSIVFPLIFGSLIATTGFIKSFLIVLIIVTVRIILSILFKDNNQPQNNKTNIKEYIKIIKDKPEVKQVYKTSIFNGLTYSEGAFKSIVAVYIIKVFHNSFSLGVFTSIFSLISCLLGLLFAKMLRPKDYIKHIKISMTITIITLIIMIINCNPITIIIFNFFQTVSKGLTSLINENSIFNISNINELKKEYKVEYFLGMEFSLFIGRFISQGLFILLAFVDIIYVLPIFIVFLILFMFNSIILQKKVNGDNVCKN